jgi:hypothetical protein
MISSNRFGILGIPRTDPSIRLGSVLGGDTGQPAPEALACVAGGGLDWFGKWTFHRGGSSLLIRSAVCYLTPTCGGGRLAHAEGEETVGIPREGAARTGRRIG